jgi:cyclic-di-GMP phosphodiesterase TipF (flagellum assembly factor)
MSSRMHSFLFFLYTLAAVGAAIWLPHFYPSVISPILGGIIGGFVFCAGAMTHLNVRQGITAKNFSGIVSQLNDELDAVLRDQRRLEDDLAQLRSSLAVLQTTPEHDVGEVVSEVRVLQRLIEQLYSARGGEPAKPAAKPAAAGAAPLKNGAAAPTPSEPAKIAEPPKSPDAGNNASLPMPPLAVGLSEAEVVELLREGLREHGVELALQPIVSLPQRKRRYFECYSRVRTADGRVLVPEQYIDIAERYGLVTAIDNMLLFRCIQMLRRLRKANANVGFFLNISHRTLADRDFFREFINLMAQNAELAPAIVFEFSQRSLEAADESLGRDLDRLAQLGYRFSVDQVSTFDVNVAALSSKHFRFMKIEATRLIKAAASGVMGDDPKAFKKMLDSYGVDLIVDRIESEPMLLELLDLHIDFGQGYLFGEPRIAKAESTPTLM